MVLLSRPCLSEMKKHIFFFSFCERHGFASVTDTVLLFSQKRKKCVFFFLFPFARDTILLSREVACVQVSQDGQGNSCSGSRCQYNVTYGDGSSTT